MVADTLMREWIARYGVSARLISDNGLEFVGSVQAELMRLLGVEHFKTPACHPATKGMLESLNGAIQRILKKLVWGVGHNWVDLLPMVITSSYRAMQHASTGHTPNFLTLGHEVDLAIDKAL